MKRIQLPFFSKNYNLKVNIPVKMGNSHFFIRMDFDKKYNVVYFFIKSKEYKKLDETVVSYISQAYIDYINNFTDLHIWNIKRILYLLHKLVNSHVFDFRKMQRIDLITSLSMNNKIKNNFARTIKQNGKIITIINSNELKNQSIINLMNFHYLNFQLLNALVSKDLVSLLNEKNKNIIKNFIGVSILIIFNLPSLISIFNCILTEKVSDHFIECFKNESFNIFFLNYILTILSPVIWFMLPKIIQFVFSHYFKKIFRKYTFLGS
jgi:hypothetical protein